MDSSSPPAQTSLIMALRREWLIPLAFLTAALFILFGEGWMKNLDSTPVLIGIVVWLLATIIGSAFSIVRHAESLAVIYGEPMGTLILTLAAITIEVMMIAAVMLTGHDNPTLARDTMFAVLMIILNGMIGLALLLGGLRHHEQTYNFYGANAFLSLIVPLGVLGLVLPNFTTSTKTSSFTPFQATFLIFMCVALYGLFVATQTSRYRNYFIVPNESEEGDFVMPGGVPQKLESASPYLEDAHQTATAEMRHAHEGEEHVRSAGYHALMLVLYLLPLAFLAEKLGAPLDYGIDRMHAPVALGGLLVAIIILAPESMSAVRAALDNKIQRSINILLGSALSTIGLTIPAVLILGMITHKEILLGLEPVEMNMLILTLIVSTLTFTGSRTNFVQGALHVLLFFAYLTLIFEH